MWGVIPHVYFLAICHILMNNGITLVFNNLHQLKNIGYLAR
jgi:hypothetical protein